MSSNSIPDSNPRLPRHKTSPRVICLNEVQAIIAQELENAESNPTNAVAALKELSVKVDVLRAGHPKDPNKRTYTKKADKAQNSVETEGAHYVGEREDGSLVYLKSPDMRLVASNYPEYAHIYGSFRTAAGVAYAMEHRTHTSKPRVF